MSAEDCIAEITAAGGRNASVEEITGLIEDVRLRAERMRRERVDLSEAELLRAAADELSAVEEMAARVEARNAKLNLVKRVNRREFYGRWGGDVLMAVEAKLVGVNSVFRGSRLSVAAQQGALRREYLGGFTVELEKAGLYRVMRSGEHDRDIARELFELSQPEGIGRPGVTGSRAARQAAEIIHMYQRQAVDGLNREGAWIGQYDGYIARTSHDPDRIRAAGFEAWRETTLRGLDERTFDGIDDRERFLREIWKSLVDGLHLGSTGVTGLKDPAFTGPGNLAKKLSQGRVLHWKDADGWMDYQVEFGTGTLIKNVLMSLDHAARHTVLMREFGTNPRGEFDADIQHLRELWHDRDLTVSTRLGEAGGKGWLSNRFDEIDGTASMPVNRLFAQVGQAVRTWMSMSKLGGVLLSAITDVPIKASELNYQGIGLLESYADGVAALVRGRGEGEVREIMELLRAGMDGMIADLNARFDATDTQVGTLSKVANIYFKWTGLTYWTDAQRAGAEFIMSRHLGGLVEHKWGALPFETKRILTLFDITAKDWDALRTAKLPEVDGRGFLTPRAAMALADDQVDGVIAGRLAEIRQGVLDRLGATVKGLDRLEKRLTRLQAIADQEGPTARDVERLDIKATVAAYARQADAVEALTERILALRDGEAGANGVLGAMRREIEGLAKTERTIGATAAVQMERLKRRIPEAEARRAEAETAIRGVEQEMLRRLDELDALPDRLDGEVARARDDYRDGLAQKLLTYFTDRGEYAVLTPGARERAMLRQGTRPGTPVGELVRFMAQFKAFPVAMVSKVWGREVHGGNEGVTRAAGIVHMVVASTVFGYIAGMAKDAFKGRNPRDPTDPKTWAAAFTQGGGAGIYGDYLFGHASRFGNSALETAAGPAATAAADLVNLWHAAREGRDVGATALRFAVSNTPFINMFYSRALFDYLILYQIQEAMNPGFLRRFERRVKEQNNQTFWLSPSSALGVR